jgi:hypothetical protein
MYSFQKLACSIRKNFIEYSKKYYLREHDYSTLHLPKAQFLTNSNDILGVLKVQGTNLDIAYLRRWAANLSVTDLLERALVNAGLED